MNLLHYIQGRRKGRDAHRTEREAMQDRFLSEALEGFESVEGDHAAAIKRLQRQVDNRSRHRGLGITLWMSIAASVALIVGAGWYFLLYETPHAPMVSETTQIEKLDSMKAEETATMNEYAVKQESKDTEQDVKELDDSRQQESVTHFTPPTIVADMEVAGEDEALAQEIVEKEEVPMESIEPKLESSKSKLALEESQRPTPTVTEALQGRAAGVQIRGVSSLKKDKRRVRGQVVDESGEPMPGVNIALKDRTVGVVTDTSGRFAMDIDDNATIVANFIGYEPKEIKADTSQLLIAMHEDVRQLEEVVVVGYGTSKKQTVTGSVSSITGDQESEPGAITPVPSIGRHAYKKYIKENLIPPASGECAGIKGKVKMRFSVDRSGRPYNLRVTRKLCDAADREAMRLITEGCNWTQGNTEATVTVDF